jgi:hypothetical protein
MKLNINNKTDLPIKIIGEIYDKYLKSIYEADAFNENIIEYELFNYKKIDYKMTIEWKISCVSILIEELDILAKDISMKNIKFPKLPKRKY